MNEILKSLLVGLIIGLAAYAIIKASRDNPKVIKIMTIIGLSIGIVMSLILLFFLFFFLFNMRYKL